MGKKKEEDEKKKKKQQKKKKKKERKNLGKNTVKDEKDNMRQCIIKHLKLTKMEKKEKEETLKGRKRKHQPLEHHLEEDDVPGGAERKGAWNESAGIATGQK